jgi:hypothetical protein
MYAGVAMYAGLAVYVVVIPLSHVLSRPDLSRDNSLKKNQARDR